MVHIDTAAVQSAIVSPDAAEMPDPSVSRCVPACVVPVVSVGSVPPYLHRPTTQVARLWFMRREPPWFERA